MTRGNQRELARAKNAKKQSEVTRKKGADDKDGNKGLNLESRKHRDAEVMREKQKKALERQGGGSEPGSSGAAGAGAGAAAAAPAPAKP